MQSERGDHILGINQSTNQPVIVGWQNNSATNFDKDANNVDWYIGKPDPEPTSPGDEGVGEQAKNFRPHARL